jgi:hypothetical protein
MLLGKFEKIEPACIYASFGSVASTQNYHARPPFKLQLHYIFKSQYVTSSNFWKYIYPLSTLMSIHPYTTYAKHFKFGSVSLNSFSSSSSLSTILFPCWWKEDCEDESAHTNI